MSIVKCPECQTDLPDVETYGKRAGVKCTACGHQFIPGVTPFPPAPRNQQFAFAGADEERSEMFVG